MEEVKRFFEDYKVLKKKEVVVEDFLDRHEVVRILNLAIDLYQKTHGERK